MPVYDTLDQEIFIGSITFYKNNPDALIPNLVLLRTANDEVKLSKLRKMLDSNYIKTKLTVSNCLNVIMKYSDCYKSLEVVSL